MKKKFKVGDRVSTDTHAAGLSHLTGVVVNNDDYPYNIHVKLDNKVVGFSEFELHNVQDPNARDCSHLAKKFDKNFTVLKTFAVVHKDAKDCSHWAKKFDKVKHIYAKECGTLCGSSAHCLGNNYSTAGMPVCEKCIALNNKNKKS